MVCQYMWTAITTNPEEMRLPRGDGHQRLYHARFIATWTREKSPHGFCAYEIRDAQLTGTQSVVEHVPEGWRPVLSSRGQCTLQVEPCTWDFLAPVPSWRAENRLVICHAVVIATSEMFLLRVCVPWMVGQTTIQVLKHEAH